MITIGLVRPKTKENIGAVLRAAGCYGASMVAIEQSRCHSMAVNAKTDTMGTVKRVPTFFTDDLFETAPAGCVPVAIDLLDDAVSLVDFKHPKNAFYIFGPEDGTLGQRHTGKCAHKVYVPTHGCMNLAATVNVILYDRIAKEIKARAESEAA